MLVLLALLSILGLAYLFAFRHVGLLEARPLGIDLGVLACVVLAWIGFARARRRGRTRLALGGAVLVSAIAGFYAGATYVLPSYGDDRPLGPAEGERFPSIVLNDAVLGLPHATDDVPAGKRARFLTLFRGFW